MALEVAEIQGHLVPPDSMSIAEAHFEPKAMQRRSETAADMGGHGLPGHCRVAGSCSVCGGESGGPVQFCVDVPNFGRWANPKLFAEFARRVEDAGWDGISVWDHILVSDETEVADPWVLLSAAAMVTSRIRLMSMVTPVPRRHPWKLARECVSVDLLSEGRLVLGVGLGWPTDPEFSRFGGESDLRTRADMLDEGLTILDGLWTGEPFEFHGDHYDLEPVTFLPTPVQQPRVPIWVAAMWPSRRPVRRAAQYDGIAPLFYSVAADEWLEPTPERMRAVLEYVSRHRVTDAAFDAAVAITHMPGSDQSETVDAFEECGVTWWRDTWIPEMGIAHKDWMGSVLEGLPVS